MSAVRAASAIAVKPVVVAVETKASEARGAEEEGEERRVAAVRDEEVEGEERRIVWKTADAIDMTVIERTPRFRSVARRSTPSMTPMRTAVTRRTARVISRLTSASVSGSSTLELMLEVVDEDKVVGDGV